MDLSIGYGLLAAFGYGTADFVAKLAIEKMGYLRSTLYMQVIGSVFILLLAGQDLARLWQYPNEAYLAVGLGILNLLGTMSLYRSFEVGQLSIVSPIASSYPALSSMLAVLLLDERVSQPGAFGIVAILTGIFLVSMQSKARAIANRRRIAAGVAYALAAFGAFGLLYFGLKLVVVSLGVFLPVLILRWVSAVVLAGIMVIVRPHSGSQSSLSLYLIAFVGILDSVANIAYNVGVSIGAVSLVSTVAGLFSAVTVVLAWLILRDRLVLHQGIGILAILAGVGVLGYFS